MRQQHSHTSSAARLALLRAWWRHTGEPAVLTMLGIALFTLPVLVLLDLMTPGGALRAAALLGWLAGGLLALRLPRILPGMSGIALQCWPPWASLRSSPR